MAGAGARTHCPSGPRARSGLSVRSWWMTTTPSRVMPTSSSTVVTPSAMARSKAGRVFSGRRPRAPRCPWRSMAIAGTENSSSEARRFRISKNHLRLDGEGQELARRVGDARLPDLGALALVQRRRLGAHRAAAAAGEEVGLRLDGRGVLALLQVRHRPGRADGVGERHQRAAVERAAEGHQLLAHRQLGEHAVLADLDEADAEVPDQPCVPVFHLAVELRVMAEDAVLVERDAPAGRKIA